MGIQIVPNPNPPGRRLDVNDGDYNSNDKTYVNQGIFWIDDGVGFGNSGTYNNQRSSDVQNGIYIMGPSDSNFGTFGNSGILNNDGYISNNGVINNTTPSGFFYNNKSFANMGTFYNFAGGTLTNNGEFTNYGLLSNSSTIINNGVIDNSNGGQIAGNVINKGSGKIINPSLKGSGVIIGDYKNTGIVSPGMSAGGHRFEGHFSHLKGGIKQIELGGSDNYNFHRINTEHDFIEVTGDLIIDGGALEVSLIDFFKLQRGQEFIIAKVDGEITGQYEGLDEGDSVGKFDSVYGDKIDLRISYGAGDRNDISLYTDPVTNPEMIFGYV